MKLRRRYKLMLLLGAVVFAAVLYIAFQSGPSYDPDGVDPRLSTLQQPYRQVKTYHWMDGGTIGIKIVDRDGRQELFAIRNKLGDSDPYTRVFAGALNDSLPNAIEVCDPEHTRRMLTRVLSDYPDRTPWDDVNLAALRGFPKDWVRAYYHKLCGHLDANGTYIY
jgi:hypothetical protein